MIQRSCIGLIFLFLVSCDPVATNSVVFQNPIKGKKASNLIGEHVLILPGGERETLIVEEVSPGSFAWILARPDGNDTIYDGPVKRKRNLYFFQKQVGDQAMYSINCMRIKGDSLFNLNATYATTPLSLVKSAQFADVTAVSGSASDTTWQINNEQKETIRAFRAHLEGLTPIGFVQQKSTPKSSSDSLR